jgi:hypothetical protein
LSEQAHRQREGQDCSTVDLHVVSPEGSGE